MKESNTFEVKKKISGQEKSSENHCHHKEKPD
jgi:hypothetical protein